jgi:hypothetical protein
MRRSPAELRKGRVTPGHLAAPERGEAKRLGATHEPFLVALRRPFLLRAGDGKERADRQSAQVGTCA